MYVCLCVCVHIATHTMITDAVCDLQKPFLREAKVPHAGCGPLHLILPVHDSAVTRSSSGGRDGRKVCHRASSQPFLDGQKNSSRKRGCGRTSRRMRLAWIVEELFWAFKHLRAFFSASFIGWTKHEMRSLHLILPRMLYESLHSSEARVFTFHNPVNLNSESRME